MRQAPSASATGAAADGRGGEGAALVPVGTEPNSAERKAARKRWANLIRHIYEVDPLVCPRCGGVMKIHLLHHRTARVIRAILASVQPACTPSPAGSLHPPPPVCPVGEGVQ